MRSESSNSSILEPLLSREQAAELLGMSVSWIKGEIRAGRLRPTKLGKVVRIEPQDLRDFIAQHKPKRKSTVADFVTTPSIPLEFPTDSELLKVVGGKRG